MNNKLLFTIGVVLCLSSAHYVRAQGAQQLALRADGPAAAARTGTAVAPATPAATFERLSRGERRIAEALFAAQRVSDGSKAVWSLNQIAAARQHMGWTGIFRQMKRDRLIGAKNLRQVTNRQYRRDRARARGANMSRRVRRAPIIVTTASGEKTVFRVLGSARSAAGRNTYGGPDRGRNGRGLFVAGSLNAGSGGHGVGYGDVTTGITVSPRVSEILDGRHRRVETAAR